MQKTNCCYLCGETNLHFLYTKESERSESFQIVQCMHCKVVQVNPQPAPDQLEKYYGAQYFKKRTTRGYRNYFHADTEEVIRKSYLQNLADLHFRSYEESLMLTTGNHQSVIAPKALDIGCASGIFLDLLNQRGWQAEGVEISTVPVAIARQKNLNVRLGDYLAMEFADEHYDLITLWASIEHLHKPKETLQNIYQHLKTNGRLIISTCRYGHLARIKGIDWRYMNVPEHLFFFDHNNLKNMCSEIGFQKIKTFSYGSGWTTPQEKMSFFHRVGKKTCDTFVKKINQGDMMVHYYEKPRKI